MSTEETFDTITQLALSQYNRLMRWRVRYVKAWLAVTGADPESHAMVEKDHGNGTASYWFVPKACYSICEHCGAEPPGFQLNPGKLADRLGRFKENGEPKKGKK